MYLLEYCFLPDDSTKLSAVSKRNTVRSLDLSKDSSATTRSTDSKIINGKSEFFVVNCKLYGITPLLLVLS